MKRLRQIRWFTPLLFIAAILFSCLFPKPESLLNALEHATLVTYVLRGLKKDYEDFASTMDANIHRR